MNRRYADRMVKIAAMILLAIIIFSVVIGALGQ